MRKNVRFFARIHSVLSLSARLTVYSLPVWLRVAHLCYFCTMAFVYKIIRKHLSKSLVNRLMLVDNIYTRAVVNG